MSETVFSTREITIHNRHKHTTVLVEVRPIVYGKDSHTESLKRAIECNVLTEQLVVPPRSSKSQKIVAVPFPERITDESVWVEYYVLYYVESGLSPVTVRGEYWWDDQPDNCEIQACEVDAAARWVKSDGEKKFQTRLHSQLGIPSVTNLIKKMRNVSMFL